jgi:uncharacterized protein
MSDYNRIITANIKDTFLLNADDQRIALKEIKMSKKVLKKKLINLNMLTLEVTEQCNLRCKYCVFNDNYDNQRHLTNQKMDWEIAKKGINYAYSLVKDKEKKRFTISFYGGEPLTNIYLIKKAVKYAKLKFNGWDLAFNMTTNLTIMDDSILTFLVANDFMLGVSLDGDQSNHDAKRVFPNGRGTHSTILKNLEKIRSKEKDYYNKKVFLSAVHSFDLPIENVEEFYKTNDLVADKPLRFSNVNPFNTSYYEEFPWDYEKKKLSFNKFQDTLLEKLLKKEQLSPLESHFFNDISLSADFIKYREFTTFAQTCLFDSRLFIDIRGRMHACEKLNPTLSFGNLEDGLNYDKMLTILKNFSDLIKENCTDCEIRFLCSRCFAQFADNETFKIPEGFCERSIGATKANLERYIQFKENGVI